MSRLDRFTDAQDQPHAGLAAALAELRAGRKRGHWIWYVFPQLSGLGNSAMSRAYAIADAAEAEAYLRDPLLRARLLAAATTVAEQQRAGVPLPTLMGSRIDVLKLVSSLTLFGSVVRRLHTTEPNDEYRLLADVSADVLAAAEREGYSPCQQTLRSLGA